MREHLSYFHGAGWASGLIFFLETDDRGFI